jgi:serine/threonine-protein kinase PknK
MLAFPARYEPVSRLGKGGGGEVWAVRDRLRGTRAAFKVLNQNAGSQESLALVREAFALSGLEGLGLPRVIAFGKLETGETYLVRELIEGRSLQDILETQSESAPSLAWTRAFTGALDQLTVLHRAGILHGDIKPANMIVTAEGQGRWVDLGLAAPFRSKGEPARGLTPQFAAPELFKGEPLTVRCEVYSAGASLELAIDKSGAALTAAQVRGLEAVIDRATAQIPNKRHPSIDEFALAVRSVFGLTAGPLQTAWPVIGFEGPSARLAELTEQAPLGSLITLAGPELSGRTTLARRLAWTLGVTGGALGPVVLLEARDLAIPFAEALALELEPVRKHHGVIVIDDWNAVPEADQKHILAAKQDLRLVLVGNETDFSKLSANYTFIIPKLEQRDALELVRLSFPSLPLLLAQGLTDRTGCRPGTLRRALSKLEGKPVVSLSDIENILGDQVTEEVSMASVLALIEKGQFARARTFFDRVQAKNPEERITLALAKTRVLVVQGAIDEAYKTLMASQKEALLIMPNAYRVASARVSLRKGAYEDTCLEIEQLLESDSTSALAADGLCMRAVAESFLGKEREALATLHRAIALAEENKAARVLASAWGSLAFVHQRGGRFSESKNAYERALACSLEAGDTWTTATTRLNLGTLVHTAGDLSGALLHFEAAVDMGGRAGAALCVQQAQFNLANLDLYLGRFARARSALDALTVERDKFEAGAQAQLLGLEAEYADRTGNVTEAVLLYAKTADAYAALGRSEDALESRLESLLLRASDGASATSKSENLEAELRQYWTPEAQASQEHEALAWLTHGTLSLLSERESEAHAAFDKSVKIARTKQKSELLFRALEARSRQHISQGSSKLARRDLDEALELLEETASKLSRDLREVFWNDKRRSRLREQNNDTRLASLDAAAPLANAAHAMTSMNLPGADERIRRIFEITRELAREHDLQTVLERVTDHAIAIVGAERGFVILANEEGEILTHTARGPKGAAEDQRFSRSIAEEVLKTGEPVIAKSALDDVRLRQAASVHQLMIQSVACIPIRGVSVRQEAIGALYLETRLKHGHLFQKELPMLLAFADQAAIAIENARLLGVNAARTIALEAANADLEQAQRKLAEALGLREEQLAVARRDLKKVRKEIKSHFGYGGLVGTSDAMRRVYAVLDRVKDTDIPVLLLGESGAGKEVVAKAIHQASARAKGTFLGLNCGAIPVNLLESELFGHVRGAFTGADREHKGLFRQCAGGTILLDEVGELPLAMQTALLRVLQEKTVRPVGGAAEEPVDVRIVAATNRNLEEMVSAGTFREDLYYRLDVVSVRVPPLRERKEDLPLLVDHFLSLFAARYDRARKQVSREAQHLMQAFAWPGNVRQLEHVLLSAWLMSEDDEITPDDLSIKAATSEHKRREIAKAPAVTKPEEISRETLSAGGSEKERKAIVKALEAAQWNRLKAAKAIGMPRRTFYRRLKEYNLV